MGSHLVLRVQVAPESELSNKQFTEMQPIFVFMFFTLASSAPLDKDQTPSWVNICGGVYLFSEDSKSWDDAFGQCELYDAHLWQIDNLAENFCLLDYAHTMGYNTWLWHSANDKESEGVWRQANGTLLSWSPWWITGKDFDGEPNGGTAANCANVKLDESSWAGQWSDSACTNANHYVCERGF